VFVVELLPSPIIRFAVAPTFLVRVPKFKESPFAVADAKLKVGRIVEPPAPNRVEVSVCVRFSVPPPTPFNVKVPPAKPNEEVALRIFEAGAPTALKSSLSEPAETTVAPA
jgi:hypothetical protein